VSVLKCKQCGFENVQDAKVCAGCGAELSTGAARIKKVTVEEAVQMMEKKIHVSGDEKTSPETACISEQEKKDGIHRFGWIFIGLGISLALIGLLLIVTMLT